MPANVLFIRQSSLLTLRKWYNRLRKSFPLSQVVVKVNLEVVLIATKSPRNHPSIFWELYKVERNTWSILDLIPNLTCRSTPIGVEIGYGYIFSDVINW